MPEDYDTCSRCSGSGRQYTANTGYGQIGGLYEPCDRCLGTGKRVVITKANTVPLTGFGDGAKKTDNKK